MRSALLAFGACLVVGIAAGSARAEMPPKYVGYAFVAWGICFLLLLALVPVVAIWLLIASFFAKKPAPPHNQNGEAPTDSESRP